MSIDITHHQLYPSASHRSYSTEWVFRKKKAFHFLSWFPHKLSLLRHYRGFTSNESEISRRIQRLWINWKIEFSRLSIRAYVYKSLAHKWHVILSPAAAVKMVCQHIALRNGVNILLQTSVGRKLPLLIGKPMPNFFFFFAAWNIKTNIRS